jgi:hypothetical protein
MEYEQFSVFRNIEVSQFWIFGFLVSVSFLFGIGVVSALVKRRLLSENLLLSFDSSYICKRDSYFYRYLSAFIS